MNPVEPEAGRSRRGRPKSPEKGAASTPERIIDGLILLAADKGIDRVSVRDVARAAGIREGSIYNHFASREAIVDAAFQYLGGGLPRERTILDPERPIDRARARDAMSKAGLEAYLKDGIDGWIRNVTEDSRYRRTLRIAFSERSHHPAADRAITEVVEKGLLPIYIVFFEIATELGMVRPLALQRYADIYYAGMFQAYAECVPSDDFSIFRRKAFGFIETFCALASPGGAPGGG